RSHNSDYDPLPLPALPVSPPSSHCYAPPPNHHSFPTRRSSDLAGYRAPSRSEWWRHRWPRPPRPPPAAASTPSRPHCPRCGPWRSEEHTSELQSRFDLVCRLLLEKKNLQRMITYKHVPTKSPHQ